MKAIGVGALLLVLAGWASGGATERPVGGDALFEPAPSVYALLGDRERLELTREQIAALDSIGRELSESTSPLEAELREMGVAPSGPQGTRRALPPEARAVLERIAAARRAASEGVGALLTVEQRALVCASRDRSGPPGGREQRGERRRDAAADRRAGGATARMAPARWSWCAAAPSADPTP